MTPGKEWIKHTNIYEVNLRQYTQEGTFIAFMPHLRRLRDMGIKTLWFMPLTPIAQKHKKGSLGSYYACSNYTAVDPEFGTLEDFRNLVQKAHALGFKVILDWVANHTGWDHQWTVEHPDWYEKDAATGDFKKASGMDDIIELDFSNAAMRKAMIEAMTFWVRETGIDGFRCDLAFWVQLDFWVEAKAALDRVADLFWLAEADPIEFPDYMQVFDAAYTWTWMHRSEDFCRQHFPLSQLLEILQCYQQVPGIKAWFTSNHDENTWNGTEYEKYGNLAKVLAVFSATWPGIPLIYSGQELPNLKRLAFFDKDPIDWNGTFALHGFYKTLLGLKNSSPALAADAPLQMIHTSQEPNVLVYKRMHEEAEMVIILNFTGQALNLDLGSNVRGIYTEAVSGNWVDFSETGRLDIEPWGFRILLPYPASRQSGS